MAGIRTGDYEAARRRLDEALALKRGLSDTRGVYQCLHNMGLAAQNLGGLTAAHRFYEEPLRQKRGHSDSAGMAMTFSNLSTVAKLMGDIPAAIATQAEAFSLWQAVGNVQAVAMSQCDRGKLAILQGQLNLAEACWRFALHSVRERNYRRGLVFVWMGFAQLAIADPTSVGERLRGARWLCGAAALSTITDLVPAYAQTAEYNRNVAGLQSRLPLDEVEEELRVGATLTDDEACDLALQ